MTTVRIMTIAQVISSIKVFEARGCLAELIMNKQQLRAKLAASRKVSAHIYSRCGFLWPAVPPTVVPAALATRRSRAEALLDNWLW